MNENIIHTTIGRSLKDLRTYQKISQYKLAKGICTQAYVSMIEKGEIIPSAHILHAFAERLGVPIDYFFDTPDSTIHEYHSEFITQVRMATKESQYSVVMDLVTAQKDNPLFQTMKMKKFIDYHLGICEYFFDKDLTKSLSTLKNTLSDNEQQYFQEDVETLIAIANILSEEKYWEESEEYYKRALDLISSRPADSNYPQKLRLYYNYQRLLKNTGNYSKAVDYADKGIKVCVLYETLYLHGEFYFYKGISLIKLEKTRKGIEMLRKAIDIFTISEKKQLKEATQKLILKYS
jgi:transcriptional regulator with XRE-family HTH domain